MPRKYFGTDGIRGEFGEYPYTRNFFRVLGASISKTFFSEENKNNSVIIGSDTRESSDEIINLLAEGLQSVDCKIDTAGVVPTPAIAHFTKEKNYTIGIMVSASHNLYYDNGIKIFNALGHKISIDKENLIEDYIETLKDNEFKNNNTILNNVSIEIKNEYIKFCLKQSKKFSTNNINVTLDLANGSNYQIAEKVFEEFGFNIFAYNNKPNGKNINKNCGSTSINNLPDLVKRNNSDYGLSMDGDGDRIVIVNNDGKILDGDDILYTIIRGKLFNKEEVKGVVGTIMTNLAFENFLKKEKIKFLRTSVGDKNVLEAMIKNGFTIGGETSGHILLLDKLTSGDSIIASLVFLYYSSILKSSGENDFLKKFPQKITNLKINKNLPENIINIAIRETLDKYSDNKIRLIIRKSGTESCVRIMVEAESDKIVEEKSKEVCGFISDKLKK